MNVREKYLEKIKKLLMVIEENHIDMYFNITKEELNEFVDEILDKYKLEDDYDFFYISNVIIKKIFDKYDSHTMVVFKDRYIWLPIRFKIFDDKIYVINVDEDNKECLYGELLQINGIDIDVLKNEIEQRVCYSTKQWLYASIEMNLCQLQSILSLPSINNNSESINYTILKEDGQQENVIYEPKDYELKFATKYDFEPNIRKNYVYKIEDDIMTIIYSSCHETYENQMINFINEIESKSTSNNISKYIVDIRGNTGGDSTVIKPLIEFLKDKEVVTLVDGKVFSSGKFAIVDLKNIGSRFVGTEIGTTFNSFGNIVRRELDNFLVTISTKYFYYNDEESLIHGLESKEELKEFKSHDENKKYFIPQEFEPSYYVENNLDDYKEHIDRMHERAKELLSSNVKRY